MRRGQELVAVALEVLAKLRGRVAPFVAHQTCCEHWAQVREDKVVVNATIEVNPNHEVNCNDWLATVVPTLPTRATDWNERRTRYDSFPGSTLYSFPGSAWERIGVEASASRVHELRMHFGKAEPCLH